MTTDRAKRAQMRDDIIELADGMNYELKVSEDYWEIINPCCGGTRYEGQAEPVHEALMRERVLRLGAVARLQAVPGRREVAAADEPESYVGRVYNAAPHSPAPAIVYISHHANGSVTWVERDGTTGGRAATALRHWRHLPNHPLATDPPREDGLGWQEGDDYYLDRYVDKFRNGKLVARVESKFLWEFAQQPERVETDYGPRLVMAERPEWIAMQASPLRAGRLAGLFVADLNSLQPVVLDAPMFDAAAQRDISPEQLRDALQDAGWEKTDAHVETWRKER